MYQIILTPLDGSTRAESILPHVENLASHFNSKVILLQIIEPLIQFINPTLYETSIHSEATYESMEDFKRKTETISTYLTDIQQKLINKGIDTVVRIEQGPVVETIISVTQKENADLVAIASHGRGGLSRVFYGSVAAGIMQKIDRPMLVIRSRNIKQ